MKGLFITFEGIDGSGKSTQILQAADYCRSLGYAVVVTREPGGTKLGEELRQTILNGEQPLNNRTVTLLLLAARSEHVKQIILPALTEGKIVLCDRFCDSTFVYQGLIQGQTLKNLTALRRLNAWSTGNLLPDLTLLLDADPLQLLPRRQQRGVEDCFENQGLGFQKQLRQGFLQLVREEPERIRLIQALGNREEVAQKIQTALKAVFALKKQEGTI